ncbi:MAG: thiamine phosphate synthase [Actinobacteria bacterium]|nr:MAG: thiamine phosphate synthase [Actinomycetota bacterium]
MARLDPRALRVYVLTSARFAGRSHRDVAMAALEGGAGSIQLRAPELPDDELLAVASELARACADAQVLFVVNDRPQIALAAAAAGAHVGREDDPSDARRLLGPDRVLGMSVEGGSQAREAEDMGADYLGVTVWATPTKPEATPGGLALVRAISGQSSLPVVGIGGIDASNAPAVLEAGAAGVAVISAVAAAPDPIEATRELVRVVDHSLERRGG